MQILFGFSGEILLRKLSAPTNPQYIFYLKQIVPLYLIFFKREEKHITAGMREKYTFKEKLLFVLKGQGKRDMESNWQLLQRGN